MIVHDIISFAIHGNIIYHIKYGLYHVIYLTINDFILLTRYAYMISFFYNIEGEKT